MAYSVGLFSFVGWVNVMAEALRLFRPCHPTFRETEHLPGSITSPDFLTYDSVRAVEQVQCICPLITLEAVRPRASLRLDGSLSDGSYFSIASAMQTWGRWQLRGS
jgi:hypothetical protein